VTPQAIVKIRFCEEAEFAGVRYTVRTKQGRPDRLWYVEVQYELGMNSLTDPGPRFRENSQKANKFVKDCFPRAWMTSGGPGSVTFGLPGQDVAAIIADLELADCWPERLGRHSDCPRPFATSKLSTNCRFSAMPWRKRGCPESPGPRSLPGKMLPHGQVCWGAGAGRGHGAGNER